MDEVEAGGLVAHWKVEKYRSEMTGVGLEVEATGSEWQRRCMEDVAESGGADEGLRDHKFAVGVRGAEQGAINEVDASGRMSRWPSEIVIAEMGQVWEEVETRTGADELETVGKVGGEIGESPACVGWFAGCG